MPSSNTHHVLFFLFSYKDSFDLNKLFSLVLWVYVYPCFIFGVVELCISLFDLAFLMR